MPGLAPSEPAGVVFHIMRFALHDGPGIRTTVFLKGCPLSCWWCHNPESQRFQPDLMHYEERCRLCGDCVSACPNGAIYRTNGSISTSHKCTRCGTCAEICAAEARRLVGRRMAVSEVMAEIERDVVFFDESGGGVTFSGGEPLAQPRFLEALLEACRVRGIRTAIETCGFTSGALMLRIAALADLVLFDLKLVDSARMRKYAGVPSEPILRNLAALAATGRPLIVRIPVVPGINDGENELRAFREFLGPLAVRRVDILPYHPVGTEKYRRLGRPYKLGDTRIPSEDRMHEIAAGLATGGCEVRIGGSS